MIKYNNKDFNKEILDDYLLKEVPQYLAKFWKEPNKWYITGDILLSSLLNKSKYHTSDLVENVKETQTLNDLFYDGNKLLISQSLKFLLENNKLLENYDWEKLRYYFGDKKLITKETYNIILLDLPYFNDLSSIEKLSILNRYNLTINQFENYFYIKFNVSRQLVTKIITYDNLLTKKDFNEIRKLSSSNDIKLILALHSFNPIAKEYFDFHDQQFTELKPKLLNLIEVSSNFACYSNEISIQYHQNRLQEMVIKRKKLKLLKEKRKINNNAIFFSEDYIDNLDEKIDLTELVIRNEIITLKNLGIKNIKYDTSDLIPNYNLAHFLYHNKFDQINKSLLGLKGKNNLTLIHYTLLWKKVDFWKILLEGLELNTIIDYLSLESCFGNGWYLMSSRLNMAEMFLRLILKKELSDSLKLKIGNNLLLYCDVGFFDFVKDQVTFNDEIFKLDLPFRSAIYLIKNGIDPNKFLAYPKKWNEEEVSILIDHCHKSFHEILFQLIKWDISISFLDQYELSYLDLFQPQYIKEVINENNFLLIVDHFGFEVLEDFGITWYNERCVKWIKKNNLPFVNKFGQKIEHFEEHNNDSNKNLDYFGLSPKKYYQINKVIKILKILNNNKEHNEKILQT